jgi:DNA-binding CsgD family transcriptional regulator
VGERTLSIRDEGYRLRGLYLKPGTVSQRAAVVVEVEKTTPTLPVEPELQERFGLTPREAEVALLLARGASNEEAGEALGISPHTVRTHAQRLFRKLGIHSRKALALRLLGGASGSG